MHESLLSNWPALVRWRMQDVEGALLRDQLRHAAKTWYERGRPDDLLWTGRAYREFSLWRERYAGSLSETEESFASAIAKLAQRQRFRRHATVVTVIGILIIVVASFALLWRRSEIARASSDRARRSAEENAKRAEANRLLALARGEMGREPGPVYASSALAYALVSLRLHDSAQARLTALEALWRGPTAHVLGGWRSDVAFSADGRWLAHDGARGVVRLWERGQKTPRIVKKAGLGWPMSLQFAADGRHLMRLSKRDAWDASGSFRAEVVSIPDGKTVDAWDMRRATIAGGRAVADLAIIRDIDVVVVKRLGHRLRVSTRPLVAGSISGGSVDIAPPGLSDESEVVLDSEGGHALYAVGDRFMLVDLRNGRVKEIPGMAGPARFTRLRLSVQANRFAAQDDAGGITFGTLDGSAAAQRFQLQGRIWGMNIDPRTANLAAAVGNVVYVWESAAPRGAQPVQLRVTRDDLDTVKFSETWNAWIGATSIPHGNLLWAIPPQLPRVFRQGGQVFSIVFSPDGHSLYASTSNGTVMEWPVSVQGREPRLVFSRPNATLNSIALAPNGKTLLVGGTSTTWMVPLEGGDPRPLETFAARAWPVAFSDDGKFGATFWEGAKSGNLRVWDLATGRKITYGIDSTKIKTMWFVKFLADGHSVLTTGETGVFHWNLRTRKVRWLGDGHNAALSADGRRLYTAWSPIGEDIGSASVIDIATGRSKIFRSHGRRTFGAAIDRAEKSLITYGWDGIIRVGPIAGGAPHLLMGHEGLILSIAVSPDGKWIATGAHDGTVRLWPMPDVDRQPLHTIPHRQLLRKLESFTNVRAVPDAKSPDGYALKPRSFHGWGELPSW